MSVSPRHPAVLADGKSRPVLVAQSLRGMARDARGCLVNGALRELLIVPLVGDYVGHVLSVCLLSGAICGIAYIFIKTPRPITNQDLAGNGMLLTHPQPVV